MHSPQHFVVGRCLPDGAGSRAKNAAFYEDVTSMGLGRAQRTRLSMKISPLRGWVVRLMTGFYENATPTGLVFLSLYNKGVAPNGTTPKRL